ncbi:unnamed protein product [Ixodes pacificus]
MPGKCHASVASVPRRSVYNVHRAVTSKGIHVTDLLSVPLVRWPSLKRGPAWHTRTDAADEPFKCEECRKSFAHKSTLSSTFGCTCDSSREPAVLQITNSQFQLDQAFKSAWTKGLSRASDIIRQGFSNFSVSRSAHLLIVSQETPPFLGTDAIRCRTLLTL